MDILGLHLSPRRNGNSAAMLEEFLRGARHGGAAAESYFVADHDIRACTGCAACEETGQCVITDDDMAELYPRLATAPRIVVATSLFFYDVPAGGKALIDRAQTLWARRYRLGQTDMLRPDGRGFLLALGATKGRDLFVPVSLCVKYFFDALGLPRQFDHLFFRQIEGLGDLAGRDDYMSQIYEAGRAFGRKGRGGPGQNSE
ncbi:MAG: flavodoxin family protein [Candidatus Adiutrix sp.]|jgi:hypothetical protein|nr:flavodoxin family protein [Candidatus Adiutrix sp.]